MRARESGRRIVRRRSEIRPALLPALRPALIPALLPVLILVALVLLAYSRVFGAGFIWDDPQYIINNYELRDLRGLFDIWFHPTSLPQWYPLVHTTFWVEYHLWGAQSAALYHVVNVALHALSAIVLWRILLKLKVPGALLAAAIFAVHPVEVESVAWVTERKNVLSLLFYLLALQTYLKQLDKPTSLRWVVAFAFFICALFSKTVTATLPAAILVIIWWKRGKLTWREVIPLIPFFILGAALGAFTSYLEVTHVGADGTKIVELHLSAVQRILIAGRAVWFYAGKILWPNDLAFIYPRWNSIDRVAPWLFSFPIALIGALIALAMLHKKIGRGPLAAVLLFCGTLAPALGFVAVYPMRFSFVADHFQYHASIALIALLSAIVWRIAKKAAFILLVPLALLTIHQTDIYQNALTLWSDTQLKNPNSWMVLTNLAQAMDAQNELTDAMYLKARDLAPNIHDTHVNAGNVYGRRGEYDRAIAEFRQAIKLNSQFAPAYFGWAQVLEHQHKPEEAREKYARALDFAPHFAAANYRLAKLIERDDPDEAIARYRDSIAYDPMNADARFHLGAMMLDRKQYDEALANLFASVKLDPTRAEVWTALGRAQLETHHTADGIVSFENALKIQPGFPPAIEGLRRARL